MNSDTHTKVPDRHWVSVVFIPVYTSYHLMMSKTMMDFIHTSFKFKRNNEEN